ncbi:MAG: class I SAM-dependent methyltransferase [Candidatus Bathyarchaeia archaeon]
MKSQRESMNSHRSEWKVKLHVMRHYDAIASCYDNVYGEEQLLKISVVIREACLEDRGAVLDVGCGTGLLFDFVAPKADFLVGLDFSRKILEKAKKREKGYHNVHLVRADADHLPFREGVFDRIFSITLLQNIPDPEKLLREILRVSKVNGVGVMTALKRKFSKASLTSVFERANIQFHFLDERTKDYFIVYRTRMRNSL